MAGISPWDSRVDLRVVIVARCFPIRVAGNSGPLKGETSWGELGLPDERTTVTNKVRRVGEWDASLLREAISANGGADWNDRVSLSLTMLDQMFPEVRDRRGLDELSPGAIAWLADMAEVMEIDINYIGTGPQTMFSCTEQAW
jgi:adenylosuccinate synthase